VSRSGRLALPRRRAR